MKKLSFIPLIIVLVSALILGGCPAEEEPPPPPPTDGEEPPPAPPEEEVFHWRWQTCSVETETEWLIGNPAVERLIEEGSGGRVQVDLYPAGALCGMGETLDAIVAGAIESGDVIAPVAGSLVPSALCSAMPYGATDAYELWDIHYNWGLMDMLREEFAEHDLYLLTGLHCGATSFLSNFPVYTTDDLAGKAVWVGANLQWLTDLGAAPTEVPGFDMYMGMKLGTIDGFQWPVKGLKDYHMMEVVDYVMRPYILASFVHMFCSMEAWNALGPDLQRQIQDHIDAHMFEAWKAVEDYTTQAVAEAEEEYGVQFITLPPEELAKMKAASRAYWEDVAASDPYAAEAIELYDAWLEHRGG